MNNNTECGLELKINYVFHYMLMPKIYFIHDQSSEDSQDIFILFMLAALGEKILRESSEKSIPVSC